MRSVVVVLPASMWAMIPMFRVRASGYSRTTRPLSTPPPCFALTCAAGSATFNFLAGVAISEPSQTTPGAYARLGILRRSPSVVREGLVGLGHLVHALAALDRV